MKRRDFVLAASLPLRAQLRQEKQPKFVDLMTNNGMEILAGPQEEFRKTIAADSKRWGDLIRSTGIKSE